MTAKKTDTAPSTDPIDALIEALQAWKAARDSGTPQERGEKSTAVAHAWRPVEAEVKIGRSNAIYDMRAESVPWREICTLMDINRARADQLLKGVSGGKYHNQPIAEARSAR